MLEVSNSCLVKEGEILAGIGEGLESSSASEKW